MQIVEAGLIKTTTRQTTGNRLLALIDEGLVLLEEHRPNACIIETPAARGNYRQAAQTYAAIYGAAVGAMIGAWTAYARTAVIISERRPILVPADAWCTDYPRKSLRYLFAEEILGRPINRGAEARSDIADAILLAHYGLERRPGKIAAFDPSIASTGWAIATSEPEVVA